MKKLKPVLWSLFAVSILAGCADPGSPSETESSYQNNNEALNALSASAVQASSAKSVGIESFIPVGKKVKIWYLQHERGNTYQVGLRNTDKMLVWERIEPNNIFLLDDIEQSYIERIEDGTGLLGANVAAFNLYLKVDTPIKGGKVSNGKNSDIQTDMIIGGGSW